MDEALSGLIARIFDILLVRRVVEAEVAQFQEALHKLGRVGFRIQAELLLDLLRVIIFK